MKRLVLLLCLLACPVSAQGLYVTPAAPDTSALQASITAASNAASAAQTAATNASTAASSAATAAANACQPMAVVPGMEVVGGAAGSGNNCRLANSIQPRITRSVAFTTGSDGTKAVTWADMGAVPLLVVQENIASNATNIPKCYPVTGTITSTGATIKCYVTQSILGLGLLPFAAATSGVTGQVLAIPAS